MSGKSANEKYLYAADRPWHSRLFREQVICWPGSWLFAEDTEDLLRNLSWYPDVRYVFFHHWSNKVPAGIVNRYECIGFHMADLPYGRGGSPLQNLIAAGHRETKVTAFRLTDDLDAGPIYLQRDLSLEGLAEEIYLRAARVSVDMMLEIAEKQPEPKAQIGEITIFARRMPEQSEISHFDSLEELFDHARMLDADGYPRAFLEFRGFRYEFSRPALRDGRIEADVRIVRN